jgi:hypothetical protein
MIPRALLRALKRLFPKKHEVRRDPDILSAVSANHTRIRR